jgi:predicted RNase H-like HicB family nuclease
MHFSVTVERDEDGVYIMSCPSFQGCHSYGNTMDEGMENIREVIAMCLEEESASALRQFGNTRELEIAV